MIHSLEEEKSLWQSGHSLVCGLDEVGRGSWAGPLVVGAVILPKTFRIPEGFGDSKSVKTSKRQEFSDVIKKDALFWSIAETPVSQINKTGIVDATHRAFRRALRALAKKPDFLLVDAFYIKRVNKEKQKAIIKGDEKCASIAAASIIAKVYRDELMEKFHETYPQYGFGKHKGYGTSEHQQAIRKYGFCQIHRSSFNLSYLLSQ